MTLIALSVTAHIENQGDVFASAPQQFVGTKGQSRRLEGFTIQPPPVAGLEIEYMAHIENQGDTHWHRNGHYCGTRGQSRRVEGFAIRLIGPSAGYYDVKYYAHVANYGDTPIGANGDFVGTRGQSRRVEGMAVWIESRAPAPVAYTPVAPVYPAYTPAPAYPVPAYTPAPAYTPVPAYTPAPAYPQPTFVPAYTAAPPPVQVTVIPQGMGAVTVFGQQFAGTKGQGRKIESISLSVNYPGLEIEYMAHVENRGDTHWHRNGQPIGHAGGGRIEGFAVRLSGPAAGQFDVKYYGHIENQGDTPVASNGSYVGTRGQSKRCEGIAVWLEPRRY
jgi:uncharacterized protein YjdB